jgi:hypothetical protein
MGETKLKNNTIKSGNGVTVAYSNGGRTVTKRVVSKDGSCISESSCTTSNDGCSSSFSSVSIQIGSGGNRIVKPTKAINGSGAPKIRRLSQIIEEIQ